MKKIFVNLKDWFNLEDNINFIETSQQLNITVFPALPYLHLYKDTSYELGVQNVSMYPSGAYTGYTSLEHLLDFNIKWAIINHRETRRLVAEELHKKIRICKKHKINIILCVSEISYEELDTIEEALLKLNDYDNIFIAYEPINSDVNNNNNNIKNEIEGISLHLQKTLKYKFPIIYGGNLSHDNIINYLNNENIDGFLISRHALDIEELKTIINLVK